MGMEIPPEWRIGQYGFAAALQQLFEGLPDVYLFAKDLKGRFTFANSGFVEKCGLRKAEELIGLTDFDVFPQYLSEQYIRDDKRVMQSGKPLLNVVELVINPGRSLDWHSTNKVPVCGDDSRVIGLVGITRDFKKMNTGFPNFMGMGKIIDYVMGNYTASINIHKLASLASLSVSQFERKFKTLFGVSPSKYITMVRIQAACQALAGTEASISRIAVENGFYDLSHFNRQFRMQTGLSPSAYRKKYAAAKPMPHIWMLPR